MRPYFFADKLLRVTLFAALALTVSAGEIVPDYDDSSALVTLTSATASSVTAANITNGKITYAARFNPAAAMADAAPAIIIENGGTSNGTGLYLINGSVVFAGKYGSLAGWSSLTLDDTDFSDNTIAVTLGQVSFGTENDVYVCYDLNTGLLTGSVNDNLTEFVIAGSNTDINFDGNNSVFFLAQNNKGWLGGLGEASFTGTTIPELSAENCVNMTQAAGYTNQLGQIFAAVTSGPTGEGTYAISMEQSDAATSVAEAGQGDTIMFTVSDDPGAYPVTISILDLLDPDQVAVEPAQLVFNSTNWQTTQSVTVAAIDDDYMERATHYTSLAFEVSVASASDYYGRQLPDLSVSITENDCGAYGYSPADFNLDCQVDLFDFALFFEQWLSCFQVDDSCQDFMMP